MLERLGDSPEVARNTDAFAEAEAPEHTDEVPEQQAEAASEESQAEGDADAAEGEKD